MRWRPWVLLLPLLWIALACDMTPEIPPADPNATGSCSAKAERCNSSGDCCGTLTCNSNKVCTDGSCLGNNARCTQSVDCCGALTCNGGYCSDGSCSGRNAHCSQSSQCCGTLTCNSAGVCEDGTSCAPRGTACTSSSQCCNLCSNGICN